MKYKQFGPDGHIIEVEYGTEKNAVTPIVPLVQVKEQLQDEPLIPHVEDTKTKTKTEKK
jgi:hypothetical protein